LQEKLYVKKKQVVIKNSWNQLKTSYYINSEYVFRKL